MFLLFNGNPSIYLLNKNKSQNRKSSCSCNFGLTFINRFRRYNHEASLRSILIKGPFKYFNVWFYNPFNYFLLITSEKGTPLITRGLSLKGIIKGSASPPPPPPTHTHPMVEWFLFLWPHLIDYYFSPTSWPFQVLCYYKQCIPNWNEYGVLSQQPS